jgi:Family of unknown function (DUF6152)
MKRLFAAMLLLSAFTVYGHHSAAGIDQTKTVTVEGTVKEFRWGNPHAWLDLEVPNKGGVDLWSFEMTSPTFLVRAGWKSTTLKFGDKVKVVARPMKNGDPGGLFVSVTLPDGKTLTQQATPAAAPPADAPVRPAAPSRD